MKVKSVTFIRLLAKIHPQKGYYNIAPPMIARVCLVSANGGSARVAESAKLQKLVSLSANLFLSVSFSAYYVNVLCAA